ncbi:DUF6090 family protein [Fulvivirga sp.]|uniref:DUF6090 family protein n=1 Tax=Fulvivirga sp. TaxID=1931237 RepID=UPI0032EE5156
MKKINWLDHFVNLIVVITGISIAFMLNNWQESKKVKRLQEVYIQSMIDDIDEDIAELDSLVIEDSESLELFRRVLEAKIKPLPKDSLSLAISKVASMSSFNSRNITYESIKSSGKFELLSLKLRIDIIEFYHSGYDQIEEIEEYYKMNFDNQIIPFLINEAFAGSNGPDTSKILSDKFRTVLGLHANFLVQKIEAYKNGHRLAQKLKDELEANK